MKYITTIILILVLIPISVKASDWYVDNEASGLNNGSSWENAWSSFLDILWGNDGIKAGDTLYISGGEVSKTYVEELTIGESGTFENKIHIKPGQESGHNGLVIWNFEHLGSNAEQSAIKVVRDYIVIDGEKRMIIKNLYNTNNRNSGSGIRGWDTKGIEIKNVDFDNTNMPIWITKGTDFKIHDNNFLNVRGDAAISISGCTGSWDSNLIYNNNIEILTNAGGPDGIQATDGISVYNNTFTVKKSTETISTQHPDYLQITGAYIKIYSNNFINIGDSAIDYDAFGNSNPHDVWIYNNIFRITESIDQYPEYIRFYSTGVDTESLNNFKILNNTFLDNDIWTNIKFKFKGNPSGSGNEIKNNIFYNAGDGEWREMLNISNSSGFNESTWQISNNIYYHPSELGYINYLGNDYSSKEWVGQFDLNGSSDKCQFKDYSEYSPGNNLELSSNDAVAVNKGLDLSVYFSNDYANTTRPQGSYWDIGAYEYSEGGEHIIIRADVDQNDSINSTDALLVLRKSLGLSMSGTNWQDSPTTGDVNCDGITNTNDALLILRYSLGLDMSSTSWCE